MASAAEALLPALSVRVTVNVCVLGAGLCSASAARLHGELFGSVPLVGAAQPGQDHVRLEIVAPLPACAVPPTLIDGLLVP
jgi:hypothetical protein